ncbi:MAG: hypothetical protein SFV22_01545 [Saprospiraceae bacterium]|nr:hypothetical protein [Saprospiraceae bacterium]
MKNYILIWMLCYSVPGLLQAQTTSSPTTSSAGNTPVLRLEVILGATASLATGDFIDYQSSFHNVVEQGTVFNGRIMPQPAPTLGLQARLSPFRDGDLQALSFSVGLQYLQRGFRNHYNTTFTPDESDYTDKTKYLESYRHHYLSIPLQARWGNKWFGTFGFVINRHVDSGRKQKLFREVSGQDAYNGGFETRSSTKTPISNSIINRSFASVHLGGGLQWNERSALYARIGAGGKILKGVTYNYSAYVFELSLLQTIR